MPATEHSNSDQLFEEAAQLSRARAWIEASRPRARCSCNGSGELYDMEDRYAGECVCGRNQLPENIGDALFGPYTCTICGSYGHPTSMHTGRG